MSPITTHILDTARGCPAQGVRIRLCKLNADGGYSLLAEGTTDGVRRQGRKLREQPS